MKTYKLTPDRFSRLKYLISYTESITPDRFDNYRSFLKEALSILKNLECKEEPEIKELNDLLDAAVQSQIRSVKPELLKPFYMVFVSSPGYVQSTMSYDTYEKALSEAEWLSKTEKANAYVLISFSKVGIQPKISLFDVPYNRSSSSISNVNNILRIGTDVVYKGRKMVITDNSKTYEGQPAYRCDFNDEELYLKEDFESIDLGNEL